MAQVVLTVGALAGDLVTVTGTVDGVTYTVTCWQSHLATLGSKAAKATYVAGLLKAAALADQAAKNPPTVDLSGTFTV